MTEAFHESGTDNLLLVALINENGLRPADEAAYRKLVDALRDDVTDVVMLQDFVSTPQLRPFLTSKDKTTWVLPVGLAGELGTPRSYDAYNRVADIVKHNVAGSQLAVHLTGPAATVADLTVAGERDRLPIELAIGVLVLARSADGVPQPDHHAAAVGSDRDVLGDRAGRGGWSLPTHRIGRFQPVRRIF